MNQFTEFSLSPSVQTNLNKHNLMTPTPVQAQAIPPALEGRDLVATAQTGTGKTLAFVLPVIERLLKAQRRQGVQALILSPTRELALQIQETFVRVAAGTHLRSAAVVGGLSEQKQLQAVRGGARVVIATPGRLSDFLDRKLVSLANVEVFVLDEADRMLDMGFLPAIEKIAAMLPTERQTLFFSATIEQTAAKVVNRYLVDPVRVAIGSTTKPASEVDLHFYEVEQDRKLGLLTHMLDREHGAFLVFARTKHGTDRLAKKLARAGVRAVGIHGDRTQNQRNRALDGFRGGEYRVLVATDVAARGIHVDGIAHVVNFDLPQAPEDFIHRVGRTGRAGLRGTASTFATRAERSEIRRIERALNVRLSPREVSADVQREEREAGHHEVRVTERHTAAAAAGTRSFGPKGRSAQRRGWR
jgi:ATP-dependent RNA helicase RhlE